MTESYLGEIGLFSFQKIPYGWLPCDGSLQTIQQYAALYSLLGVTYGGDGKTTFRLPDLRSRVPVSYGQSPVSGQIYAVGGYGGVEQVALTSANLPPHTHSVVADATDSTSLGAGENYFGQVISSPSNTTPQPLYAPPTAGSAVPLNPGMVSSVGSGSGHNNMQPYLAMSYCICSMGVYPSRP